MVLLLILLLISSIQVWSQGSIELQQAFLDLSNDGVLMNVSAHPDDEDGAALSYYRMKYGVKTYSVLFTRGEGGQNEKGPELYEELGVLRTEETKAAATIIGAEPLFLNLVDFGFSKTATEAFGKWGGRTEVLRRLVYFIRKLKPDIIFTNHNTIDGHGHHQVVAITAIAAFDAAADSTFFPEQLREPGVALWQPRKLFFRNFSQSDQTADVANAIEEVDSIRHLSYLDIASNALRMHKTQGLDRANLRAFTRGLSRYKLIRASSFYDKDSTSFFSGIELWSDRQLADLAGTRQKLSRLRSDMPRDSLFLHISILLKEISDLQRGNPQSLLAKRLLSQWQTRLESLASLVCDIKVKFTLHDPVVVAKQKVECTLEISSDECAVSGGVRTHFNVPRGWALNEASASAPQMKPNRFAKDSEVVVGDNPIVTLPKSIKQYNPIEADQTIAVAVEYRVNGNKLSTSVAAEFEVAPQQTLAIEPQVASISSSHLQAGKTFEYRVKNYLPHKTAGRVRVVAPPGWRAESASFVIEAEDSTVTGKLFVAPPDTASRGDYVLTFRTDYAFADVTVRVFDVAVAKDLRVGIIRSYDTVLESITKELGVRYKMLDESDLGAGDLSQFNSIVIDIRAYLVRDDLKKFNMRLLEYVKAGGNLIVMYQRDQEWKPEYAPFPFKISRRRVTVEEAPVTVLKPNHLLFNQPNAITDESWRGWKQERAVYFPIDVSDEYVQLLSSHDPDEPPLTTGYFVGDVGAGSYIYTSYVWYRQLKDMHRGALACFANMISYPTYRHAKETKTR